MNRTGVKYMRNFNYETKALIALVFVCAAVLLFSNVALAEGYPKWNWTEQAIVIQERVTGAKAICIAGELMEGGIQLMDCQLYDPSLNVTFVAGEDGELIPLTES
jgi:hydrogenase maturation factor